jgi:hypothetical protein
MLGRVEGAEGGGPVPLQIGRRRQKQTALLLPFPLVGSTAAAMVVAVAAPATTMDVAVVAAAAAVVVGAVAPS